MSTRENEEPEASTGLPRGNDAAPAACSWSVSASEMMPRDLLRTAEHLRVNRHWESAVVFAQTACELCTELVIIYGFHRLLTPASPERPFRCKLGEKIGEAPPSSA